MESDLQQIFDDGIFAFSQNDYEEAIGKFRQVIEQDPSHFDAIASLGMSYYRLGDYARAIEEGHKAEKLRPNEQTVHTNLSLFYMKNGEKEKAEHHGLQARIAGWRTPAESPAQGQKSDGGGEESLPMAAPKPENIKLPPKFPDMPWKKK